MLQMLKYQQGKHMAKH